MGLNIREIVDRRELNISELKGQTLCVDAFNTLYQFISTIRQPDGTPLMDDAQRITSHLSGIFYRNIALLSEGIKLVYVFDGKAPDLKAKTHKKRKEARDIAEEKYHKAEAAEDDVMMKKYSSQLLRLDDGMIKESKELLEALGIAVVQAPSEGEAESAYLAKKNKNVYACVSQDYDSLLFGAPKLIRNLTVSRRKKTMRGYVEVKPEIIELDLLLTAWGINIDKLICLGILVGTDYNPKGVPRIGQKKALDLVRKFETPEEIFESVREKIEELPEEDKFDWKEIFELFKNPESKNFEFIFPQLNKEKIKEILIEKHNFSEERVDKQLERLKELAKKNSQTGLNKWF
jgi:flap endonuclease-1